MKTETISTADLATAIHDAFRGRDACHCQGDGKLSEAEFRTFLFAEGILTADDLPQAQLAIDGTLARRFLDHNITYPLEHRHGVRSLSELRHWRLADLLRLEGVGPVKATEAEKKLALLGISLADGDPALIGQARREQAAERRAERNPVPSDLTPEETRETAATAVFKLGEQASRDGASLMRFAYRLASGKKVAAVMKKYVTNESAYFEGLRRVVAPLAKIEEAESARKKATKQPPKRTKARTTRAVVETQDNVVRAAFGR